MAIEHEGSGCPWRGPRNRYVADSVEAWEGKIRLPDEQAADWISAF